MAEEENEVGPGEPLWPAYEPPPRSRAEHDQLEWQPDRTRDRNGCITLGAFVPGDPKQRPKGHRSEGQTEPNEPTQTAGVNMPSESEDADQ